MAIVGQPSVAAFLTAGAESGPAEHERFLEAGKLLKTITEHYRVDRRQIAFIKFIFEAYDGIAGLKTTDPAKGIIMFHIAPGCEEQVHQVLQDLKKQILIKRLVAGPSETG